MTIRDIKQYTENLWDWGFLDKCFGINISVSDLDGIVERNGLFLVIETKLPTVAEKDFPRGQERMFENLVATGYFTVLLIWGKPNEPERMSIMTKAQPHGPVQPATTADVQEVVSRWYKQAIWGPRFANPISANDNSFER